MPFGQPPVEALPLFKGIRSSTLSIGASDTQNKAGCDFVCNGVDDQVAINAAIATLPIFGGLIHLLEGHYTLSDSIVLASNVAIIGTGANTVITIPNGFNANIDFIIGTNINNVLIKDLRIDGNQANQTAGVMRGIHLNTVTDSVVTNCWIENIQTTGIMIRNTVHSVVEGCWVRNTLGNGIYLRSASENRIVENIVDGTYVSVDIEGGSDRNEIADNHLLNSHNEGVYIEFSDGNIVTSNVISGNGWHGILLAEEVNHSEVLNNEILNNGLIADNTHDGIHVDYDSDYNSIQGNLIRTTVAAPPPNRQRYGINIAAADCDANLVINNDIHQSGQTGDYNDVGALTVYHNNRTTAGWVP